MTAAILLLLAAGPADGPSAAYLEAIERYRRSGEAAPVGEAWSPERVQEELARLKRLQSSRVEAAAFPYEAAAMFHTDRYLSGAGTSAHLEAALQMLELIPDPERRRRFEPRWLLAVGLRLHETMEWDQALRLLDTAVRRYRDDAQLWLARGSLLETILLLESQAGDSASSAAASPRVRDAAWQQSIAAHGRLLAAEDCYRHALACEPGLAEARVRLGHVLQRRGQFDRSVPELEAVLQSTAAEVAPRYLAQLFLGAAHEAAGSVKEAVAAYEAAVRTDPESQTAHVALSYALYRSGARPGAEAALRAGLARAGSRSHPDPWWVYPWGRSGEAEHLLEELRQEVSR